MHLFYPLSNTLVSQYFGLWIIKDYILFQGNKGAVSVRFNIYGCSVCLVNCHLTAHDHLLAQRVTDYNTIVQTHLYHVAETSHILYHEWVYFACKLTIYINKDLPVSPLYDETFFGHLQSFAVKKIQMEFFFNCIKLFAQFVYWGPSNMSK